MRSTIRTRPRETSILPRMLGTKKTSKTTQILKNLNPKIQLILFFQTNKQTVFQQHNIQKNTKDKYYRKQMMLQQKQGPIVQLV